MKLIIESSWMEIKDHPERAPYHCLQIGPFRAEVTPQSDGTYIWSAFWTLSDGTEKTGGGTCGTLWASIGDAERKIAAWGPMLGFYSELTL